MTVPSNYDTDFIHSVVSGVIVNVQDFVDQIVDDLTNNLPVDSRWVSLGGDDYQSPIQDPGGANRSLTLNVVALSATRVGWIVKDQNGAVVLDGSFDLTPGPAEAHIYVGPNYAVCEIESVGTGFEHGFADMTDPGSFGLGSTAIYVSGRSTRDSAGNVFGGNANNYLCMLDISGPSSPQGRCGGFSGNGINTNVIGSTTAGSIVAIPMEITTWQGGTLARFSGRAYQVVSLPSDFVGPEIDVPLDEATIGTFRRLVLGGNPSNAANIVVAMRAA